MTLGAAFLSLATTVAPAGLAAPVVATPAAAIPSVAVAQSGTSALTMAWLAAVLQDVPPDPAPAEESEAERAAPPNERSEPPPTPVEETLIDGRRRPDIVRPLPDPIDQFNPGAVRSPPPEAFPTDHIAIPDRWRLIQSLGIVRERWWDPYNQNTLKGDRPLCIPTDEEQERRRAAGIPRCATPRILGLTGPDWFFVGSAISDTVIEPRSFPIPGGEQNTQRPDSNDVFGRNNSLVLAQTFIFSAALIKGSTAYKPPDVEWRITLAAQANYVDVPERRVLDVRPSVGSNRFDYALGVQEAFLDYHVINTSYRYDFWSIRVGIQPFNLDFRGFLFQDQQLGFRLFGNRDNNRWQFNLAAIWRLEKDTNSGLNNLFQTPRQDWVLHANVYRQDFPFVGLTSEASVTWNINRERDDIEVDDNGFPVRPALIGNLQARNYDAFYFGYNVDGRIGRMNLSASAYALFGTDRNNIFTGEPADIRAFFAAAEPSYDFNWVRLRGAALFASGDDDPFDNVQRGFDAIFENPIFAGADTSYWIRQTIPFAGGARAVSLNGRNGILNSLRSSKEQGQSNFVNPGTMLLGVGADFDLTPALRLSANANHLWFHRTGALNVLRQQQTIRRDLGWDLSAAVIWRPTMIQNVVFRVSGAVLQPGTGFRDLFTNVPRDDRYYSILFNAILTY
ncbi:MAG: hypothetical protein KF780_07235 [Sphingomonas sp.]|nr:hypothetical protein [Sphingomonas sp.]